MGAKTKGGFMTIEVTGCHDCPFANQNSRCKRLMLVSVKLEVANKILHPSCPLKQETITIKLKSDETNN
jgi:hypothetical protein